MNFKHLFWIIPLVFLAGSFFVSYFESYYHNTQVMPEVKIKTEMSHYWACMEGCSIMQEVLGGKPLYNNETAKFKHDVCAEVCCRQYMTELECE